MWAWFSLGNASQVRPSLVSTWETSSGVTVLPCPGLLHRWGLLDAKREHYLPKSQCSPNYCGVLGSLSIRVAAVVSSSCDRWPGSSQLVGNGIRANSKLFFPLKKKTKNKRSKKEKDSQTPTQLSVTCNVQGGSIISTKALFICSLLTLTFSFFEVKILFIYYLLQAGFSRMFNAKDSLL